MPKDENNLFATQDARIMYNDKGEPELLMIPIKSKSRYLISEDDITTAVRDVRLEVYQQFYA
jgi:hypothetical protein